jgi:mannose-6-phosphate isomerase-like protein (cupin superfamily)
MAENRQCIDLDKEIESLIKEGYRLDMITPADSPRKVQLSKNGDVVRLLSAQPQESGVSHEPENHPVVEATPPLLRKEGSSWRLGRAGMMYRDLIPGRLNGKLIASHIRLTEGGPVADYVHYHKIDFQLIYCLSGRIRVVYEGQGEPFWLEAGDCVLQPPEMRHRVLECEAGSEVLELSSPAEHETWVDHEMTLPTSEIDSHRLFGGQRFVHSIASEAKWQPAENDGVEIRNFGIYEATSGLLDVTIRRMKDPEDARAFSPRSGMVALGFVVAGKQKLQPGDTSISVSESSAHSMTEILRIEFRDHH